MINAQVFIFEYTNTIAEKANERKEKKIIS